MSKPWITRLLAYFGLAATATPPIEVADYLRLSTQCVRGIARQVAAGGGTLLARKQCRGSLFKAPQNRWKHSGTRFKFGGSSTMAFRPALENFHRIAEKSRLLVNDCSSASVLQIHNVEETFREILLEVGLSSSSKPCV